MIQLGEFLGRVSGPLFKTGLSLLRNVLKPLAKSILISLGLTVVSTGGAAIQKKMFGFGFTLIVSNKEVDHIIKITKSLENQVKSL